MITMRTLQGTWWSSAGGGLAAALVFVTGCLGPPPMAPLTGAALEAAEQRWTARGCGSYHLAIRIRAPRLAMRDYEVDVSDGVVVRLARSGEVISTGEAGGLAFTIPGIFALLRKDLALIERSEGVDEPPIDLRAFFEPETGRLVRYRRTVGSDRRRVLLVEVVDYEEVEVVHGDLSRGSGTVSARAPS